MRFAARQAKQGDCAERKAHRVDWFVGEGLYDTGGEVSVGGRVVRLWGGAVTEQIDANNTAINVFEERGESALLPSGSERTTPSMHENNWRRHGR